jgi:predicted transcriptional regulator
MKYRSRTDITSQILEAAIGGATKSKIMYKSFLSFEQLKEYLDVLVKNGLLAYDKSTPFLYKTTSKGQKFVSMNNELSEYLSKPEYQRPARAAMA